MNADAPVMLITGLIQVKLLPRPAIYSPRISMTMLVADPNTNEPGPVAERLLEPENVLVELAGSMTDAEPAEPEPAAIHAFHVVVVAPEPV